MSTRTVSMAVVGAGAWGKNHVRNLAAMPGVDLRYACDRSEKVRGSLAREYPNLHVVPELEDILGDRDLDAVVVATDAPHHYDVAARALRAGKDCLVEKPLALSVVESRSLDDLATENRRVLMVGHLLLHHPAIEKLREILAAGEIGRVLYLTSQRTNLGIVRRDENAWWSLAPHDISLANYLLAAQPEAVSATGAVFLQKDRGLEDVVFATLDYPDGRLAHLHVSWLDPHKTRRLTVVGDRKMAVFDDTSADQKLVLFDRGVEPPPPVLSYAEGVRVRTGDIVIPALRMVEPLRRQAEEFVKAILTRVPPRADGRSGVDVVRVLAAGSVSLEEHGRRVPISEVD